MPRTSPTVRRRRLARMLAQLRENASLTADEAVAKLKQGDGRWSQSKISRIESAILGVAIRDAEAMLDAYGVTEEGEREAIVRLARQAREKGWWAAYNDVIRGSFIAFEAEAAAIKAFEPLLVPGLLQTPAYAEAMIANAYPPREPDEVDKAVQARMTRGLLLEGRDPPQLRIVIGEAALRQIVGSPDVMCEQIDRLIALGERTTVKLQLLPARIGAHPGVDGGFALLEFDDPIDSPLVFIEVANHALFLESDDDLACYRSMFEDLSGLALGPPDTSDRLAAIKDELG